MERLTSIRTMFSLCRKRGCGLPRQCAHWLAMTIFLSPASLFRLLPSRLIAYTLWNSSPDGWFPDYKKTGAQAPAFRFDQAARFCSARAAASIVSMLTP